MTSLIALSLSWAWPSARSARATCSPRSRGCNRSYRARAQGGARRTRDARRSHASRPARWSPTAPPVPLATRTHDTYFAPKARGPRADSVGHDRRRSGEATTTDISKASLTVGAGLDGGLPPPPGDAKSGDSAQGKGRDRTGRLQERPGAGEGSRRHLARPGDARAYRDRHSGRCQRQRFRRLTGDPPCPTMIVPPTTVVRETTGGGGLYFIVGALVVAVLVGAYVLMGAPGLHTQVANAPGGGAEDRRHGPAAAPRPGRPATPAPAPGAAAR